MQLVPEGKANHMATMLEIIQFIGGVHLLDQDNYKWQQQQEELESAETINSQHDKTLLHVSVQSLSLVI